MKRHIAVLVLVSFSTAHTAHAEIVTVPFESIVTHVGSSGPPFGIHAALFETIVSGTFMYDTSTPLEALTERGASFHMNIPNGFVMNIGGVSVTSSSYDVGTGNSTGRPDDYIGDFIGVASELLANGAGSMQLTLRTSDNLFSSVDDARTLPTSSELDQVNMVVWQGFMHEPGEGNLAFRNVPEPCAILLVAQVLFVLGARRREVGFDSAYTRRSL